MADQTAFPSPATPGDPGRHAAIWLPTVIAVVLAVLITVADYLTDPYLTFATFYLVPVAIMAWYATVLRALVFCGVVTAASVLARASNPGQVRPVIVVTNGLLRLALFVFAVLLVQAERTARTRVAKLSTTDPLTGTLNRRAFVDLGADRLLQAARRASPVTLVYLDLDDLKRRNDRFGHEAGDRMITTFADAMRATFRATDLVTRIGGDEFCCLLGDTDENEAIAVLTRFEAVVSQIGPEPMSASMGAVTIVPTARTSIADLIHQADLVMYEAKLAGKGQLMTRSLPTRDSDHQSGTEVG